MTVRSPSSIAWTLRISRRPSATRSSWRRGSPKAAHARRPVRDGERPARGDDGRGAGGAARAASSPSCATIPISPARRRAPAPSPTIREREQASAGLDTLSRGGVRALPSAERCLQGEVRLPLHDLRAPPHARIRSWRSSSAAWRATRRPSSPRRCRKSSTSRGCGSRQGDGRGHAGRSNGRLSTHVLDTHAGRPAVGVAIELYELAGRALSPY